MINLDLSIVSFEHVITHHIGNKMREEKLIISNDASTIKDDETKDLLLQYFLGPFKVQEFHQFTHTVELKMNEVYSTIKKIFEFPQGMILESQNIAKLLFDYTNHPKIKSGELNVVYFQDITVEDEITDAVGIFKSETNVPFIKMQKQAAHYDIDHEFGFELKGIDKACLVLKTEEADGYRVLVMDHTNRNSEALYWVDDFLKLTPVNDEYHQTKDFLSITKDFVTGQLPEEHAVSKTDQIDLLNKTMEYFKIKDNFDKTEFEQEVFQDEKLIQSFRDFDSSIRSEQQSPLQDQFEISGQAVKKQSRIYKSVLKLDKNFHVYIHGNRDLIERGTDLDGRKYYKIYYENEQ